MEEIILYVDQLSETERIGLVKDAKKIEYNQKKLSELYKDDFADILMRTNEAHKFGVAGRFMYMLQVSLNDNRIMMAFIDVQNNDQEAIDMALQIETEESCNIFIDIYYAQKETYQQFFNLVRLVAAEPPSI